MSEDAVLRFAPVVIALGNIVLVLLLCLKSITLVRKLVWLAGLCALTFAIWFLAALPTIIGQADSAPSCLERVGDPGCRRFEELSALMAVTLGNFNYLWALFALDLCIVIAGWYISQRKRGAGPPAKELLLH